MKNPLPIVLVIATVAALTLLGTFIDAEGDWVRDGYDLGNSRNVNGTAVMDDVDWLYRVQEGASINGPALVVDLEGDGHKEMVYSLRDGHVKVRNAETSAIIKDLAFGGSINCSVLVEDVVGSGELEILVVNSTRVDAWLNVVSIQDWSVVRRVHLPGPALGSGKVHDVDADGHQEVVLPLFNGKVVSVDMATFRIDWTADLAEGLALTPAVYEGASGPMVVVTSGISFIGEDVYSSGTLTVLDGADGSEDWSMDLEDGGGLPYSLATPPTVVRTGGRTLIAFGAYSGALWVLDHETREVFMELDGDAVGGFPYWEAVAALRDPGNGDDLLVFQGSHGTLCLRLRTKEVAWTSWHTAPKDRVVDQLVMDVDGDGVQDLVQLGKGSVNVLDPLDGSLVTSIPGVSSSPSSLQAADVDGDGVLEVIVLSDDLVEIIGGVPSVSDFGLSIDGNPARNGSVVTQYAMYRDHAMVIDATLRPPLGYLDAVTVVMDPGGEDVTIQLDPSTMACTSDSPHVVVAGARADPQGDRWSIEVTYRFNWSFPHEDPFGIRVAFSLAGAVVGTFDRVDVLRVENDIEVAGAPALHQSGRDGEEGWWFSPCSNVTVSNLTVSYEGAPDHHVDGIYFRVVTRCAGRGDEWTFASGGDVLLDLDVSDLPTGGYDVHIDLEATPRGIGAAGVAFRLNIDADVPVIVGATPANGSWLSTRGVSMSISLSDGNGSGVDPSSVGLRLGRVSGSGTSFEEHAVDRYTDLGGGTLRFETSMDLGDGEYLVIWSARDRVGNEVVQSHPLSFYVSTGDVDFLVASPVGWQNRTTLEVSITIRVSPPTRIEDLVVEMGSGRDIDAISSWTDDLEIDGAGPEYRLSMVVDLLEGVDNHFQWRVTTPTDRTYHSNVHRVSVDTSAPVFGTPSPDLSATHEGGDLGVSIPATDVLSGIDAGTCEYALVDANGAVVGQWSAAGHRPGGGGVIVLVNLTGLTGKENRFIIRVADVAGNVNTSRVFNVMVNEAPTLEIVGPGADSVHRPNATVELRAEVADPDPADGVVVNWYSSVDGHLGTGASVNVSTLSRGDHVITATADDGHGHNVSQTVPIHVVPAPGAGGGSFRVSSTQMLLLAVLVVIVVVAAVLYTRRSRGAGG